MFRRVGTDDESTVTLERNTPFLVFVLPELSTAILHDDGREENRLATRVSDPYGCFGVGRRPKLGLPECEAPG